MRRTVTLDAKPGPIDIDPARAAVIVVDMQNDCVSKGGMFDRIGVPLDGVERVVAAIAPLLASARQAGIKIVYLRMGYQPDLSDLGAPDSPNRVRHLACGVGQTITTPEGRESRILIRDSWGTEIVSELAPQPEDLVLYKHRYSGFYETELDQTLKRSQIRQLIITGCTTSVCVESTLRDAHFRDYQPILITDCVDEPIGKELPRSNHAASLLLVERLFGWLATSDQFVTALHRSTVDELSPAAAAPD